MEIHSVGMHMSTVSRQRALIALRSYPSVAAAARSINISKGVLLRMTLGDKELSQAYKECLEGVIRAQQREEHAAEHRERKANKPRITERTAEKRKARLFAAMGADPRLAAGALHKRLNHERRQEKAAALEEALDVIDSIIAERPLAPLPRRVIDVWDRWCARCKQHRVDDPCEACGMHTIEVK